MPHESLEVLARGGSTEPQSRVEVPGPASRVMPCPADAGPAADPCRVDPATFDACRVTEALLFASAAPVRTSEIARVLPEGTVVVDVLTALQEQYKGRGVELAKVGNTWAFRTASDIADRLTVEKVRRRKLSRAGLETLAIVAYHAPVTRAEIEEIRGVSVSPGTLDILFEEGWIEPRGRKQVPGRPTTWQTTPAFLDHFGLESRNDLPGLRDLQKAGLLTPTRGSIVAPADDHHDADTAALTNTA